MCGIAGIFWADTSEVAAAQDVERVLDSMRYRGPDALGVFHEGPLAMGNVRLAIQGIDPKGNQPIYNEDKTVVVVFNGEIYNFPELRKELEAGGHRFATATDTELLVHLYEDYGDALADRLNGMFAFALYDRRRQHLLLGRDRTAQKPFFLFPTGKSLAFASELRALLPWIPSPCLNPVAARDFLSLGYFLEPGNLLCGVSSLPPGCVRTYERAREIKERILPLPPLEEGAATWEEWQEDAVATLRRAVRRHTLSDVPVTVFLSGGVDSSLLAACLASEGGVREVHTGSFSDEPDFDETPYSRALAERLGLGLVPVNLSTQSLTEAIEPFCADSSQPQGDYSGLPSYLLARETARNYKVVLGGDAGDELFGGYPTYTLPSLQKRFPFLPAWAIRTGADMARRTGPPRGYLPWRFRLQLLGQAWGLPTAAAHFAVKDFLPQNLAPAILHPDFFGDLTAPPTAQEEFCRRFDLTRTQGPAHDVFRRLGRLDFSTFLGSCTIPKMERNCMRWSLENRLPFLDLEVLALSARTPAKWQWREGKGKWALRKVLKTMLGSNPPLNPRKQGFGPPLARMLREGLREWSQELLERPHPAFQNGLANVLARHTAAGWDLHRLVWNICILKDWTLRHGVCGTDKSSPHSIGIE